MRLQLDDQNVQLLSSLLPPVRVKAHASVTDVWTPLQLCRLQQAETRWEQVGSAMPGPPFLYRTDTPHGIKTTVVLYF